MITKPQVEGKRTTRILQKKKKNIAITTTKNTKGKKEDSYDKNRPMSWQNFENNHNDKIDNDMAKKTRTIT